MTIAKQYVTLVMFGLVVLLWGCSSDDARSGSDSPSPEEDRQQIEATLAETAVRWHYGDKAVLYEQEFEYVQVDFSYDKYLEVEKIRRMEADTVKAFLVKNVHFFGRDSARVAVDVVFVGPSGATTYLPQEWTMFYHRGRWIRPTMSTPAGQQEFEERRRRADSAAAAEEDEEW
ncbi:MAG: hypothetical protein AB1772_04275 [Candidatus Zixiibacteriota bacterium]